MSEHKKIKTLELVIGDLYYLQELQEAGYKLARFHASFSMFYKDQVFYHFKHIPFKKLKIRYEYVIDMHTKRQQDELYTTYDKEVQSELYNCCNSIRFGG